MKTMKEGTFNRKSFHQKFVREEEGYCRSYVTEYRTSRRLRNKRNGNFKMIKSGWGPSKQIKRVTYINRGDLILS